MLIMDAFEKYVMSLSLNSFFVVFVLWELFVMSYLFLFFFCGLGWGEIFRPRPPTFGDLAACE